MRKSNLYYSLVLRFGSLKEASKALHTTTKDLEAKTLRGSEISFSLAERIVKALGIENNADLIDFVLFRNI